MGQPLVQALELLAGRRGRRGHSDDIEDRTAELQIPLREKAQRGTRVGFAELRQGGSRCRNRILFRRDGDAAILEDISILHIRHDRRGRANLE